jgi:hypothetical protein
MNRALALILVIWGAGTALVGIVDVLAGNPRPGHLIGSFVVGPLLVALGFWVDRRGKPKPQRWPKPQPPSRPIRRAKVVNVVGAVVAAAAALTLLILAAR